MWWELIMCLQIFSIILVASVGFSYLLLMRAKIPIAWLWQWIPNIFSSASLCCQIQPRMIKAAYNKSDTLHCSAGGNKLAYRKCGTSWQSSECTKGSFGLYGAFVPCRCTWSTFEQWQHSSHNSGPNGSWTYAGRKIHEHYRIQCEPLRALIIQLDNTTFYFYLCHH